MFSFFPDSASKHAFTHAFPSRPSPSFNRQHCRPLLFILTFLLRCRRPHRRRPFYTGSFGRTEGSRLSLSQSVVRQLLRLHLLRLRTAVCPPFSRRHVEQKVAIRIYWNKTWNYLSFLEGVRELTLEFLGFTMDSLDVDLIKEYNQVSGYWLWSYVVEGLRLRKPLVWFSIDCGVTVSFIYEVVYLTGMVSFGISRLICVSFKITRWICASFGITRLICVSFGITRLICASFGIMRLICASFGITRLICASFGITGLMCAFYGTTRLFM
ncbi:mucin-19-like isoform X13 [Cucumis melo var. makuwa]|uniref:Mucin-19-like isoform X13 n=1 Tax=Cucumis melo var. makuwa TaxID=1194695 RepID=A0A5D3DET7_CUCMM|nr:mucin-19-like isoform X13 [Cucumis melo var. makuwa]